MTDEVRICTSLRTISASVMYYSKYDQEMNAAMIILLTEWLKMKQRKRPVHEGNSQTLRCSLTGVVAYKNFNYRV